VSGRPVQLGEDVRILVLEVRREHLGKNVPAPLPDKWQKSRNLT
jgi:hypothetical protein